MARISATEVYCGDEDLLIACPAEYPLLVPSHQRQAYGKDGVFAASAGGSWVLTSASQAFSTLGVLAGQVCQLKKTDTYRTPDLLIVDSVSDSGLTLRRVNQDAGVGYPPGPESGVSGVEFTVLTLWPQIEDATYHINQVFDLDDQIYGRRYKDLYDPRELNRACVEYVLWNQYLAIARQAEDGKSWYVKATHHKGRYEALASRVEIHIQYVRRGANSINRQARVTR